VTQLTPSYITTANTCLGGDSWNGETAALKLNPSPSQLMVVNGIADNSNLPVRCVTVDEECQGDYNSLRMLIEENPGRTAAVRHASQKCDPRPACME
jgi:hypothetical protein